jgi:MFS family permease
MPEARAAAPAAAPGAAAPGALAALVAEAFLSRLAFGIMAFALPLYARALGMGLAEIAVLISANTLVSMLLKPHAGRLADRLGHKAGAVASIAARSLLTLAFAAATLPWQLFALQGGRGLAKSLRDPSIKALIAEHGGKGRIASAFAWYKTATSAAGALGKALAGLLITLTAAAYGWVFLAAFALSVLPLLAVAVFVPRAGAGAGAAPAPEAEAAPAAGGEEPGTLGLARSLWPALGFGFLVSGTAQMLRGLFPILAVEYGGLSEAETGLVLLGATVVTLVAGPLFGRLADRGHRRLVLSLRGVANVASSLIYLLAPGLAGFAAAKAVDEAGKAAFHPAWGSLAAELAGRHPGRRGAVMGWLSASDDAGSVAGPILAGLVWGGFGVGALLGLRVALAVLTEIYAATVLPRATRRRPAAPPTAAGTAPSAVS